MISWGRSGPCWTTPTARPRTGGLASLSGVIYLNLLLVAGFGPRWCVYPCNRTGITQRCGHPRSWPSISIFAHWEYNIPVIPTIGHRKPLLLLFFYFASSCIVSNTIVYAIRSTCVTFFFRPFSYVFFPFERFANAFGQSM